MERGWPVTSVVDTSVLIDYLRGHRGAATTLEEARAKGPLHASEVTRLEVLAGMRRNEEAATESLLSSIEWHALDRQTAEQGAALGRRWLPSHSGIDSADLAVAALATLMGTVPLTCNVRHFPMFPGLRAPY